MKVTAKKERHMERPTVWDTDIEQFLTPQRVLVVQIIQSALAVGALAFLAVVFYLYQSRAGLIPTPADQERSLIESLSVMNVILGLAFYGATAFLDRVSLTKLGLVRPAGSQAPSGPLDPVQKIYSSVLAGFLVRWALMEASSIFGLVVCLLAITSGVAYSDEIVLLNILPAIVFIFFTIMRFVNREELLSLMQAQARNE